MTYSMGSPSGNWLSEVKSTPVELIFLVSPRTFDRDPSRTISKGRRSSKRWCFLCSIMIFLDSTACRF
jgi:hypothetical protein